MFVVVVVVVVVAVAVAVAVSLSFFFFFFFRGGDLFQNSIVTISTLLRHGPKIFKVSTNNIFDHCIPQQ